jgi:hypothetical protein
MMMKAHKAVALAMKLNKDDPEWHYIAKHIGIHAKIEVFDENNIYLGELGVVNTNLYEVSITKLICPEGETK